MAAVFHRGMGLLLVHVAHWYQFSLRMLQFVVRCSEHSGHARIGIFRYSPVVLRSRFVILCAMRLTRPVDRGADGSVG